MCSARKLVAIADSPARLADNHEIGGQSDERRVLDVAGLGVLRWRGGHLVEASLRALTLLGVGAADPASIDLRAFETVELALGPDVSKRAVWLRALDDPERVVEVAPFPRPGESAEGTAVVRDVSHEFVVAAALKEAQDNAEAFAYRASHDLLGPARRTRMFCGLLTSDESVAPHKAVEFAACAARSAKRMTELVHALLEYSRSGNQTRPLNPRAIDLAGAVQRALASQIEAHGGAVATVNLDVAATVFADLEALDQVLCAVLGNALLYHEPSVAPCIWVRSRVVEGRVELEIEDGGIGIAAEHLDKVFAPFERLHAHSAYPGHGLALATARRWVARMDGALDLGRSEPGAGSTFRIQLRQAGGAR